MNLDKAALIRALIAARRYADFYDLLVGISASSIDHPGSSDMDDAEQDAWQHACMHVAFLKEFGPDLASAQVGKIHRFSYPEEFESWIDGGAVGLDDDSLAAYLTAKPL